MKSKSEGDAASQQNEAAENKVWSLRPPDDLRTLVNLAMKTTGQERQKLIFECIRRQLPNIVKEQLKIRQAKEDELMKMLCEWENDV